jgi:hypothetical protein
MQDYRTFLALALCLTFGTTAVFAGEARPPARSDFRVVLGEMWAKLRAVSPRLQSGQPVYTQTVTAGVRGAEATESELKPYWRGDREQDPAYRAEHQALQSAQRLADDGKYAEAAKAFRTFVEAYPRSPLASEARFGKALALAMLGEFSQRRCAAPTSEGR